MKKLLSVVLSIVLVMGFTPIPAMAEPGKGEANGGTTTAGETDQMVIAATEDSQVEGGVQHDVNAQTDEGDGATRSDMTAQASGKYEYEGDYSGCYLLYREYTDDIGSGVVIYEIGMPYTPYRFDHYHPGVDPYLTIPAEIDGKPVVGIGYDYDNGFRWQDAGQIRKLIIPSSVRFVNRLYVSGAHCSEGLIFEDGSPVTELYPNMFEGWDGTEAALGLPDGLTAIYDQMFIRARQLDSITLPSAARYIGEQAFYVCGNLTSITLNDGLEVIGKEAFAQSNNTGFDGYQGGYLYNDAPKLTELAIPNSVIEIEYAAFRKMVTLSSVSFGTSQQASNLTTIGARAFFGTNLTSVALPDSVQFIGAQAFSGTNDYGGFDGYVGDYVLASVQLGSSQEASKLVVLEPLAFAKQPITSITIPNSLRSFGCESEDYGWKPGRSVGDGDFTSAEAAGEDVTLSPIKYDTCDGKRGYSTHMYVPGGYYPSATMGAFSGCDKLETIVWPTEPGLTTVGGFDNCVSLTEEAIETIPNWVTRIDDYAFYNCVTPGDWGTATTNLRNVTIPSTVVSIGKGAFSKRPSGSYALSGTAPVYTLTNPAVQIDYDPDNMVATSPWPIGCGYTIRYPASALPDSSIMQYRAAVEAYEAQMNVEYNNSGGYYDYAYTVFIPVPDTEYAISGTVPEGATATLLVNGAAAEPVEGAVAATAVKGAQVAVVVSMDGYASYTVAPEGGWLNADWTFAVAESDLTPISETGSLYVIVDKDRATVEEAFRAAIGCNVIVFDQAGRIAAQGIASIEGTFEADELPAGSYTVVAYDDNEWFSGITSIDDFGRLGVLDGSWIEQAVVVEAGKFVELEIDVPDLQLANPEDILDSGSVTVPGQRLVPNCTFNVRVNYAMKSGSEASTMVLNIPAGVQPITAATTKNPYDISGYDATEGSLSLTLKAGDKQGGTLYVTCKVATPGAYNVSAAVSGGAVTAALGTAAIDAPALKLLAPSNAVTGSSMNVDVYAAPGSTIRFQVGGMAVDAVATTNKAGRGKTTLTIPEDVIATASVTGELAVTAYMGDDPSSAEVVDAQTVTYQGSWNVGEGFTEWELSFEHAGQEVYLTRNGQYNHAVGYTVVQPSHLGGRTYSHTWPFTYVALSDRELGDTAVLDLRMLDGSEQTFDMQLTATESLGGGVARYTYTADVPIGQEGAGGYAASEIPNGFSVVPQYVDDSVGSGTHTRTQEEVDALKASTPITFYEWWTQARETEAMFLGTKGYSYDERTSYYFQHALSAYEALVETGEDPDDADILGDFIFNSAYHHENWEKPGMWNDLDAGTRQKVLEFEDNMDQLCVLWQEAFETTRPLNEYSSFDQYMEENYGYQEGVVANPAELKAAGYDVIYDDDPAYDDLTGEWTPSWYAVRYTLPEDVDEGTNMTGASEDSVMLARGSGESKQGKVEVVTSTGVSIEKKTSIKDTFFEIVTAAGQLSSGTSFIIEDLLENPRMSEMIWGLRGNWQAFCTKASKALSWIGTALGIVQVIGNLTDSDFQLVKLRLDSVDRREKRLANEIRWLETVGKTDSRCYRAMLQEAKRLSEERAALRAFWWGSGTDLFCNAELAAVSYATASGKVAINGSLAAVKSARVMYCVGAAEGVAMVTTMDMLRNNMNEARRLARNAHDWSEAKCGRAPEPDHTAALYIDPSGWVFEGTPDNLVEGVTATIYYQDEGGDWVVWDADEHDQVNPQVLDEAGFFRWDTPPGKWKVVFTADGYDAAVVDLDGEEGDGYEYEAQNSAETPAMDVPPEWTNIMVNLLASAAPAVEDVAIEGDEIVISFDQYMDTATTPTVKVDGKAATVTWDEPVDGINATGAAAKLSKSLRVPVPAGAQPEDVLKVALSGGKSYAGKALASVTRDVKVPGTREYTVKVTAGTGGTAKASVAKGAAGTKVTLTATSNNGYKFKEWQVVKGGVTISGNTFTIGKANVEVKAVFEKETAPATKRTVSFDANGGSGTMAAVQVDDGATYTLPKCTFTPPAGKEFDKWDKGAVGAKVKVTANMTLKAQWKSASQKKDVGALTIAPIPDQVYTGQFIFPWEYVKVYDGTKLLKAEVDYMLVVPDHDNVNPGTGRILLGGMGDYTGTRIIEFKIVPLAPQKKTAATKWNRLWGNEALDTMQKIVDAGWKGETGGTVVLATDAGYWDALTAAGIAGFYDAPVLMTAPDELSPQTEALLKALKPAKIVICGGPAVVHDPTADAAAAAAGIAKDKVVRYYGTTMTDTADDVYLKAAKDAGGTWSKTAFVATSNGYWDALAAAPVSYTQHMPIFLTESLEALSANTIKAMRAGGIEKVVIVGGERVVAPSVERQLKDAGIEVAKPRLAGESAIDTSILVAEYGRGLGMTADNMGVATQKGHWDALAGAALCGKLNSVLVLVNEVDDSPSIKGFAGKHSDYIATGYIFGGELAISPDVKTALEAATPAPKG